MDLKASIQNFFLNHFSGHFTPFSNTNFELTLPTNLSIVSSSMMKIFFQWSEFLFSYSLSNQKMKHCG